MDELRKKTDKELAKLEKKLDSVYRQAEKDIAEKWDEYMKEAAEKLEPLEKAYASAKASGDKEAIEQTGKALGQEKFRQTLQNARFKDMLDETTEKIADVNKIALSYINDEQPKVYSNNYNGTLKEVKNDIKGLNTGVKFNMVDERTVKELARKKDLLYSQKTLNRAKDKKWNLKALTSQVTQGILQGESVPDIAKRLAAVSDMNRTSCIRNARTMTTTSENSGRLAGLKEAEEKGIVYEKQWMATNDDRTRESHAELDGVSVPVDEPFPNGLMYPGDMSGDAEEVYNCRCSMVRNLIGFRSTDGDVVEVGDIERYERRTPAAAKTETPTEIAEEITAKEAPEKATVDKQIKGVSKNTESQAAWIEENLGYTKEDAKETIKAVHAYTDESEAYTGIHNNDPKYSDEIKALDKMINDPNMPVYEGTIYRGLHISDAEGMTAEEQIRLICETGRWNEAGITSFSSERKKANNFATGGAKQSKTEGLCVMITNKENKSAVAVQHLSGQPRPEGEVLYGSSIKDRGFEIVKYNFKDKVETLSRQDSNGNWVDVTIKSRWCEIEVRENDN